MNNPVVRPIAVLATLVIALGGCTSSHNTRTDGKNLLGGGYYEATLQDGLHYIQAKTNFGPLTNTSGARRMWEGRARELCGASAFRELGGSDWSYEDRPGFVLVRYIITVREGFAVCADSGLSDEQAIEAIKPQCTRFGRAACEL